MNSHEPLRKDAVAGQRLLVKPALGPKMKESKSNKGASRPLQAPAQDGASSNSHPPSSISAPCPIRFTRAIVGEMQQARDLTKRLLRISSPLGLYAYHVITLAWPRAPSGKRVLLTAGLTGGER